MFKIGIFIFFPISLFAQQLVSSYSIDTAIYTHNSYSALRGPENGLYLYRSTYQMYETDLVGGFHRKGTDKYDIYSFSGKVGTSTIPSSAIPDQYSESGIFFSQFFIDSDSGWESIVWYEANRSEQNPLFFFKVFDENGTQLLSDTGNAYYGCDGQNTYVHAGAIYGPPWSIKIWRFRSNISTALSQQLSKSTAYMPGPMMWYLPNGGLRVNVQPSAGGTSLQIFDILGRQVFQRSIQNVNGPISFTIPASSLPNSPIVTKVNNNKGSFINKAIPVR